MSDVQPEGEFNTLRIRIFQKPAVPFTLRPVTPTEFATLW